jgi:PPOX class probable F420-dependent enzyme
VANNRKNSFIQSILTDARVARLATIDFEEAKPHVVPVVFVFDGNFYYIPVDGKPKKDSDPKRLRRIKNIQQNPNVALLIDEYNEDWSKLFFVMIQGKGDLIGNFSDCDDVTRTRDSKLGRKPRQLHLHQPGIGSHDFQHLLRNAQSLLLEKYPQYQKISVGRLCIMIRPEKVFTWKMSGVPNA